MFELCKVSEITDDVPLECDGPEGQLLIVVRQKGDYYAFTGECPHQGAPLADGEVSDGVLTCCLHFWSWCLADGEPLEEAEEPLKKYPIRVVDDAVFLLGE